MKIASVSDVESVAPIVVVSVPFVVESVPFDVESVPFDVESVESVVETVPSVVVSVVEADVDDPLIEFDSEPPLSVVVVVEFVLLVVLSVDWPLSLPLEPELSVPSVPAMSSPLHAARAIAPITAVTRKNAKSRVERS